MPSIYGKNKNLIVEENYASHTLELWADKFNKRELLRLPGVYRVIQLHKGGEITIFVDKRYSLLEVKKWVQSIIS